MKIQPLSQEGLKLIACVTMLLDHMGAVLFPEQLWLRIIGRIAFPIYCFLLAEGAHYTKNPIRYGLRLLIGLLLAEIPFDLVHGGLSFHQQNVMFTLLLGFLAILSVKHLSGSMRLLALLPIIAAELLRTDYGAMGVFMILMFFITRNLEENHVLQAIGLLGLGVSVFKTSFIQPLAVLAILPISLYSGKKVSDNKVLQWGFYLFYPVHLLILWLISEIPLV